MRLMNGPTTKGPFRWWSSYDGPSTGRHGSVQVGRLRLTIHHWDHVFPATAGRTVTQFMFTYDRKRIKL